MLDLLFSNPYVFILSIGGIILAIGIHEAAHCFVADYLGDPTPRSLGRLSLNPLVHLDPLGLLIIVVTGFFGWGKPSPVDPYNLKNPRRDMSIISLAGPASNLILAVIISLIIRFIKLPMGNPVTGVLINYVALNVSLAVFNLLPIAPLDGSKIFFPNTSFSPRSSQTGYLILILLIVTGLVSVVLSPVISFILDILL